MNIKIIFAGLLTIMFSSCMDCMDCQVSTDINLSVEYYSLNSSGDMSMTQRLILHITYKDILMRRFLTMLMQALLTPYISPD